MMDLAGHKRALETRGITKFDGLVSKTEAGRARDLICEIAAKHGLHASVGWQRSESRFGMTKPFRAGLKTLAKSGRFPNFVSADMIKLTEDMLGEPVEPISPGQQILFTLPGTEPWSVPADAWHTDMPRLGKPGPPGLQMFVCLDEVAPKGGGTLVVAGSHRLVNPNHPVRSKDIRQALGKEAYFRSLFDGTRAPITCLEEMTGMVDDIELDIVELTGQMGDVYFMDLRILHTLAPNASETARMMLTCRLPRAAVASDLSTGIKGYA